jgi:purine-nucleoside phosphorylase
MASAPDAPAMNNVDWNARLDEAATKLRAVLGEAPAFAVILGSGLASFTERLQSAKELPFESIPHFPTSSVAGHPGRLVCGGLEGQRVVVAAGRVHAYEGYSGAEVAFPVRVLARWGVRAVVMTNASGCINPDWEPGDLMRISDHINLSGRNPLAGPNDHRIGPRFPDLTRAYDPELAKALDEAAAERGILLRAGIYAHVLGPSYETPAEIRMLRALGADAVGMSTVPEVIAAAHAGLRVAAVACLTNMAAGIRDRPLSHAEVTDRASRMAGLLSDLLEAFLARARPLVG